MCNRERGRQRNLRGRDKEREAHREWGECDWLCERLTCLEGVLSQEPLSTEEALSIEQQRVKQLHQQLAQQQQDSQVSSSCGCTTLWAYCTVCALC